MSAANCVHGEHGPCQCFAATEPREYRNDWIGEHYPIETQYGVVSIQPLGWGVRVATRRDSVYVNGERVVIEDPPLVVNGMDVRLSWYDVPVDSDGNPGTFPRAEAKRARGYGLDDATASVCDKLTAELPPLVCAWLDEPDHHEAFQRTREAYLSNQARTCEESIAELESALIVYRERLALIETGDLTVSPYLNGGKGIAT